jgi:hypothetical protein
MCVSCLPAGARRYGLAVVAWTRGYASTTRWFPCSGVLEVVMALWRRLQAPRVAFSPVAHAYGLLVGGIDAVGPEREPTGDMGATG